MTKQAKSHHDLFFVSLVAVVILAAMVIMIRASGSMVFPSGKQVEGATSSTKVSTSELLQMLDGTNEDATSVDFSGLKEASSGL